MAQKLKELSGFTMIELIVVMVILSIGLILTVPGFRNLMDETRLQGAAEAMYSDFSNIRLQAIKENKPIYVTIMVGENWCYGFDDVATNCDCNIPNDCQVEGIEKTVKSTQYEGIKMDITIAGTTSTTGTFLNMYGPRRGIPDITNEIILTGTQGKVVMVRLRQTGRVAICSDMLNKYSGC